MRLTLTIPDYNLPFHCFSDSSFWACASMLAQKTEEGKLNIIGVSSKLYTPIETRYVIYHKESVGLAHACLQWSPHMKASTTPINVYTDAKAISY